ncbi:hypothetical protein CBP31_02390 [Oceanisphaera profunda]|uniref:Uncharacterized protein n=1 Tax=Oceanisphaera profunda TaxID=1416627 RepID=A0A1Y0D277_9GAMM|nr:hypothetical protein [Oceanisphaera profunda]ART81622.1 hypothetical protein CBP31_02390 [Oceanisphaera profunda]
MRMFTTSLILTALLGLTACEPSGPSADIGDNINQVTEESLVNEPATTVDAPPFNQKSAPPMSKRQSLL